MFNRINVQLLQRQTEDLLVQDDNTTGGAANETSKANVTENKTAASNETSNASNQGSADETDTANAKCYSERYKDLGNMKPKEHFEKVGHAEGRLWSCQQTLTDSEALSYILEYPDVQSIVASDFKNKLDLAREHFFNTGFNQSRQINSL